MNISCKIGHTLPHDFTVEPAILHGRYNLHVDRRPLLPVPPSRLKTCEQTQWTKISRIRSIILPSANNICGQTSLEQITHQNLDEAMVDKAHALPLPSQDPNPKQGSPRFFDYLHRYGLIHELNTTLPHSPYMHVHILMPLSPLQSDWLSSRWRISARVYPIQLCLDMIGFAYCCNITQHGRMLRPLGSRTLLLV